MNAQALIKEYSHTSTRNETKTNRTESLVSANEIVNEIETIRTYRVGGARGPLIAKTSYFTMADAILSLLFVEEEVSLVELVNHVERIYTKVDAHWLLLQVKQDLEQKGFITSSLKGRSPYVSLIRKVFLKSEFRKTLLRQMDGNSKLSYFF